MIFIHGLCGVTLFNAIRMDLDDYFLANLKKKIAEKLQESEILDLMFLVYIGWIYTL